MAKGQEKVLKIPAIDFRTMEIELIGETALCCHQLSAKTVERIEKGQDGSPSIGKEKRDPKAEFNDSYYEYPGGGYGFPASAFKLAAVRGAKQADFNMTDARAAFHVLSDAGTRLVKLKCSKPVMQTDLVRLQNGSGDLRYRAYFRKWSVKLLIRFNSRAASAEQIINFFRLAGFGVGVGDWRPEKNGTCGMFDVAKKAKA